MKGPMRIASSNNEDGTVTDKIHDYKGWYIDPKSHPEENGLFDEETGEIAKALNVHLQTHITNDAVTLLKAGKYDNKVKVLDTHKFLDWQIYSLYTTNYKYYKTDGNKYDLPTDYNTFNNNGWKHKLWLNEFSYYDVNSWIPQEAVEAWQGGSYYGFFDSDKEILGSVYDGWLNTRGTTLHFPANVNYLSLDQNNYIEGPMSTEKDPYPLVLIFDGSITIRSRIKGNVVIIALGDVDIQTPNDKLDGQLAVFSNGSILSSIETKNENSAIFLVADGDIKVDGNNEARGKVVAQGNIYAYKKMAYSNQVATDPYMAAYFPKLEYLDKSN